MALTDILRQRVEQSRQTLQLDCGSLGALTVEALPLRECALLLAGSDANRSILYAACRELQRSGEVLRQEGKVFRPEDVTQHISNEEAAQAAEAILTLSGWTAPTQIAESETATAAAVPATQDESEAPASVDRSVLPAHSPSAAVASDTGSAIDNRLINPQALYSEQQAIPRGMSAPAHTDADLIAEGAPARSGSETSEAMPPVSMPVQQISLQEQRVYDEEAFVRRLLVGLRRAAAVR